MVGGWPQETIGCLHSDGVVWVWMVWGIQHLRPRPPTREILVWSEWYYRRSQRRRTTPLCECPLVRVPSTNRICGRNRRNGCRGSRILRSLDSRCLQGLPLSWCEPPSETRVQSTLWHGLRTYRNGGKCSRGSICIRHSPCVQEWTVYLRETHQPESTIHERIQRESESNHRPLTTVRRTSRDGTSLLWALWDHVVRPG